MLLHNLQTLQVRDKARYFVASDLSLLILKHKADVDILTVCGTKVKRFLKN